MFSRWSSQVRDVGQDRKVLDAPPVENGEATVKIGDISYTGHFVEGKKHGYGVEKTAKDEFRGYFHVDARSHGTVIYPKGHKYLRYEGTLASFDDDDDDGNGSSSNNNKRHGHGMLILSKGSTYSGEFVRGRIQGRGVFTQIQDGEFHVFRGTFVEWDQTERHA
eukprot:GABV01001623.1.p2 GENE.GABV01001623.1~~GABV01001623.1.p2  ORF type:complete len:164 (-),score=48.48 GABV01001623.1:35-526(-)